MTSKAIIQLLLEENIRQRSKLRGCTTWKRHAFSAGVVVKGLIRATTQKKQERQLVKDTEAAKAQQAVMLSLDLSEVCRIQATPLLGVVKGEGG